MGCCNNMTMAALKKLKEQAKSAILTATDVLAEALRSGEVAADKNTIDKRVGICKSCEYLNGNRCNLCGCYINAKAGLKASTCPKSKW